MSVRIGEYVLASVAGWTRQHKVTGAYTRDGIAYLVLDHSWEVSRASVRRVR